MNLTILNIDKEYMQAYFRVDYYVLSSDYSVNLVVHDDRSDTTDYYKVFHIFYADKLMLIYDSSINSPKINDLILFGISDKMLKVCYKYAYFLNKEVR